MYLCLVRLSYSSKSYFSNAILHNAQRYHLRNCCVLKMCIVLDANVNVNVVVLTQIRSENLAIVYRFSVCWFPFPMPVKPVTHTNARGQKRCKRSCLCRSLLFIVLEVFSTIIYAFCCIIFNSGRNESSLRF